MRHVCPECGEPGEAGTCTKDKVARVAAGADTMLGTQIGSWRIARLIGAGGMGRVYEAVQPEISGRVAIKVLKDAGDAEHVERFFNEARAVNMIRHEGIVDVIDMGRLPDGSPYIVMELLDGTSLRALIRRSPRPSAGTMARILVDVLSALAAAHAKAIIHRDLKPDNVFVSPGGRVTVLDFGIAKLVKDTTTPTTATGNLLGTPAYMSPEQARSQPIDARSDLYSVGVMLYEAATGVLPFNAPSLYDLLDQHVKSAPKPPREIDLSIPEALEVVILRALAKDPADRFASASEMRDALAASVEHLPIARLPSVDPDVIRVVNANAATQASMAFDKTRKSEDPGKPPPVAAAVDTGVRVSRAVIVAMIVSALLGLGAVAYVVMRTPEPTRVADVALDASIDAMLVNTSVDATIVQAIDATITVAQTPPDAKPRPKPEPKPAVRPDAQPEAKPDFSKTGVVEFEVKSPSSVDAWAFYAIAEKKAAVALGGAVHPTKITIRRFDRDGKIDLADGSGDWAFALDDQTKADGLCSALVLIGKGKGTIELGHSARPDKTCPGRVPGMACTPAQMWEVAFAKGIPREATRAHINQLGIDWVFLVGDVSVYIDGRTCK